MTYTIRCADGRRWKVREAVSLNAACDAINMARVTGSIGSKNVRTDAIIGRSRNEWPTKVMADVIQINSDNTECQPYTAAY